VNSCIKYKQYFKPIITASELLISLNVKESENWYDFNTIVLNKLLENYADFIIDLVEKDTKNEKQIMTIEKSLIPVPIQVKSKMSIYKEDTENKPSYDIEEGISGIPSGYSYEKQYK